MANTYKNIIFDLGGVLLQIDAQRSIQAFRELGMPEMIRPGGWGYNHPVFLEMEAGKLSDEQFRTGIQELLPQPVSNETIDNAWCAMILEYFPERIELVRRLSANYRVFLFSNTNAIHIRHFQGLFKRTFQHELSELFEKDYYSSEIGLRKPDPASFDFVLNDAGLKAEETLFVDDSDANIESAKKTGMNTIWLTPESDLLSFF
ncbi:HAD family hydrolase [Mangrovibacterium diazotrophicum]|uniref:Putative hydrolase of the HAD superfamily n=1 Tax=Mangrovibacterium diazotrophicum TaxID=1261403 RepID=A0A419W9K5_9BACT|nr:HAD family phosphatase [Mangrovibacterium diazotrophicum]RKD92161.1 putative hydrolase of the HAD superfamily [Mangrovibacterium diazotrophicum]